MKKAVLYSTETCPNCVAANALLTMHGYTVEYLVIGKDISKDNFWTLYPGQRTVPLIIINGSNLNGLEELKKFL